MTSSPPATALKAIASPELVERGCVNLIMLDRIRERAGDAWPHVKNSIYTRAEALLGARLGPTDLYIRFGEASYLIAMPTCTAEEAQVCCVRISYDLHRSLFGECHWSDVKVARAGYGGEDFLALSNLSPEEIQRLAARHGLAADGGEQTSLHQAPPAPRTAPSPRLGPPPLATGVRRRTQHYEYRPIWDVRHETVNMTYCELQLTETISGVPDARHIGLIELTAKERMAAELGILNHVAGQLAAAPRLAGHPIVVVPAGFSLLHSPVTRMEFVAGCRSLPGEFRSWLVFCLTDLPGGVTQGRLADVTSALRPFCRAVFAEYPFGTRDLASYEATGLYGIWARAGRLRAGNIDLREEIAWLVSAARAAKLRTAIDGIVGADIAAVVRREGAAYLGGPYVGPALDVPGTLIRLPWAELAARENQVA